MDGSRSANRIRAVTGSVMSPSSGGAMARNNHDVPGNLTPILFTYQVSGYHKMMVIAREHCSLGVRRIFAPAKWLTSYANRRRRKGRRQGWVAAGRVGWLPVHSATGSVCCVTVTMPAGGVSGWSDAWVWTGGTAGEDGSSAG